MVQLQFVLSVVYVFFENLFMSGPLGGWVFLTTALETEGMFSHLCSSNISKELMGNSSKEDKHGYPTCDAQTETFNLVFIVSTSIAVASCLLHGIIFERFGIWICRMLAIVMFAAGSLFMANSGVQLSGFLFPGMILLGCSGSMYFMTNAQLANLYPNARSSIISILTGAFLSSNVVFWAAAFAYESGFAFSSIFYCLACLSIISFFVTFLLTPRRFIPHLVPEGFTYGLVDCKTNSQLTKSANDIHNYSPESAEGNVNVWSHLKTPFYWTNLLQLASLHICNEFFQGTVNERLKGLTDGLTEIETYTKAFGIFVLVGGLVAAPVTGTLVDFVKDCLKKKDVNADIADLKAVLVSSIYTSGVALLFSVSLCVTSLPMQYFTYLLYVMFRVAVYSNPSIGIAVYFPTRLHATLFGFALVVSAVVSLIRYPLLSLVLRTYGGSFTVVNVLFVIVCLFSFIHPAYVLFLLHKTSKSLQRRQELQFRQPLTDLRL